jgi:hypothetical protein
MLKKKEPSQDEKVAASQLVAHSIPIRWASLHSGTDFPGGISAQTTLNETKVPGIKMYLNPGYLLVLVRGKQFAIPLASVKNMEFEQQH